MMSSRRFRAAAAIALAVAALNTAAAAGEAAQPDDMTLGNPNAKVTVVEYASASCPHCAHFNNAVFPAFKAKYIDTGRVHFVFREFLTPPAEVASAGFLIARCAGKDKYFSVLDTFFRGQEKMYETGDIRGALAHAAGSAGMTEGQYEACLSDPAALKALDARIERNAKRDDVQYTPTFIINGKKMDTEATLANLDAAIAAAH